MGGGWARQQVASQEFASVRARGRGGERGGLRSVRATRHQFGTRAPSESPSSRAGVRASREWLGDCVLWGRKGYAPSAQDVAELVDIHPCADVIVRECDRARSATPGRRPTATTGRHGGRSRMHLDAARPSRHGSRTRSRDIARHRPCIARRLGDCPANTGRAWPGWCGYDARRSGPLLTFGMSVRSATSSISSRLISHLTLNAAKTNIPRLFAAAAADLGAAAPALRALVHAPAGEAEGAVARGRGARPRGRRHLPLRPGV